MLVDENQIIKVKWSDNFRQYYIDKGYVFTKQYDDLYVNMKDLPETSTHLVKVKCDCCGKEYEKRYESHIKSMKKYGNDYCKSCIWQRTQKERQEKMYSQIIDICNECGYSLITPREEIKKTDQYIVYRCNKHGEMKTKISNILSGKRCSKCYHEKASERNRFDYDFVEFQIEECGGHLLNKYDYVNNHMKNLRITCPRCGSIFVTSLINFTQHGGQLCDECYRKESIGEFKIRRYLESKSINFQTEKWFSDCRDRNPLPFDFYLPDCNTIIEFDGAQHFKDAEKYFHSSYSYEYCVKHDEIKNNYCKENNIKLIRIPYWDINKIEMILDEQLLT